MPIKNPQNAPIPMDNAVERNRSPWYFDPKRIPDVSPTLIPVYIEIIINDIGSNLALNTFTIIMQTTTIRRRMIDTKSSYVWIFTASFASIYIMNRKDKLFQQQAAIR